MTYIDINEQMAKFLGWECETYPSGHKVWYVTTDIARYVAAQELKFHNDWNELMKVVTKIATMPMPSDQPKNTPIGWTAIDEFRITLYSIWIKAYKRVDSEAYWEDYTAYDKFNLHPTNSNMLDVVYKNIGDFINWYYDILV